MEALRVCALACLCLGVVYGQGAGRAIPVASENFVIELFRTINPGIEYDKSNFLVDLSGNYANCDFIGRRRHDEIDRRGPNNERIGLIQDYTRGEENHVNAVDGYLREVFEGWVYENTVPYAYGQISNANRFGCSVRPGCRGQVSVACLFSPYYGDDQNDPIGEQRALAFTEEQYDEAENQTNQAWDRSHFLENLSGFETRCDMIFRAGHDFAYAKGEAFDRGMKVEGLYEWAENEGSTPNALRAILRKMKQIPAEGVGCSLIPDCDINDFGHYAMYVIVSCVFEV